MPTFLEQPTYGPQGPDGLGWNRLSLNAHVDQRHQCGWQPHRFATLFEALTGRQQWGGFGRCFVGHPGSCGTCPVQLRRLAREGGINWPDRTPLFLARTRPWPPTPGALFADPAAGRSSLELFPWRGGQPILKAGWMQILNTPGLRISWCWQDGQGEAFWLVREHPTADAAVLVSTKIGTRMRHDLYGGQRNPRVAVLTCLGSCAHETYHLQQLAADLADRPDRAGASGPDAEIPAHVPGVPRTGFAHDGNCSLIHRDNARDYDSSTVQLSWDVPFDEATATALVAHAVRLSAI
ncbi:hypothetical protein [Streptomyces tauricus]|uniref:hypothetical protein n=1 Tax=Streptomyces tauricus TaxID=68274 RepID=UPI0022431D7B|nr:hypothetical protein [Streptomyces tauricus]MCW8101646.1 hypothetical protein [Streptomyces tauricus]